MDVMMHNVQDPEGRSFKNLYQYIIEDDIIDLLGDTKFASFLSPFKTFSENEIKESLLTEEYHISYANYHFYFSPVTIIIYYNYTTS